MKTDKFALYVNGAILRLQRRWAESMSKMAARCSLAQQKTILILLTVMMSTFCGWLILQGFVGEKDKEWRLSGTGQISAPVLVPAPPRRGKPPKALIDYFRKVGAYTDSIRKHGGTPALEKEFPGLEDSIRVFESYPLPEKNNKK